MKGGRPPLSVAAVGELLGLVELVAVTEHGQHALSSIPITLTADALCRDHSECLSLHCKAHGRYLRLHLTRDDAVRLSHLLYYKAIPSPLHDDE